MYKNAFDSQLLWLMGFNQFLDTKMDMLESAGKGLLLRFNTTVGQTDELVSPDLQDAITGDA